MINENRLQNNLEAFSFPRLYGTEAEKKACNIAKKKIEELAAEGYEYNEYIDLLLKQNTALPYDFILFCLLSRFINE